METVITKTEMLEKYLIAKEYIKYDSYKDYFIIHTRNEQQLFWVGVGYGHFIELNK